MRLVNTPRVNARYWIGITLASIFGTNLGDIYAHESGLGIVKGLIVLAVLAGAILLTENRTQSKSEAFYWAVIILIRTGATNIADYLAFRVRIPELALTGGLILLLGFFGLQTRKPSAAADSSAALPKTGTAYWLAMLTAGVFGTVVGDITSHHLGEGVASIGLGLLLLCTLIVVRGRATQFIAAYWVTVAIARTAGTSMGDWFAENKILNIGLPLSTLITGVAFSAVLLLWRSSAKQPSLAAQSASSGL